MPHKSFEDVGIPPEYAFKRLLFCAPADTLVVQTRTRTRQWRPERLLYRHTRSQRYVPVGRPGEMVSQDDPVVSPSSTLLAYNTNVHKFEPDAEGIERHSADWECLRIFDLSAGVERQVIDKSMLSIPAGTTRGWISKLLSFAEPSDALHVVVALCDDPQGSVDYHVAALNVRTADLRLLALLPAVFM